MTTTQSLPNPGSPEAVKRGCMCPIEDNQRGTGIKCLRDAPNPGPYFWVNGDCPMHVNPTIIEEKHDD